MDFKVAADCFGNIPSNPLLSSVPGLKAESAANESCAHADENEKIRDETYNIIRNVGVIPKRIRQIYLMFYQH